MMNLELLKKCIEEDEYGLLDGGMNYIVDAETSQYLLGYSDQEDAKMVCGFMNEDTGYEKYKVVEL